MLIRFSIVSAVLVGIIAFLVISSEMSEDGVEPYPRDEFEEEVRASVADLTPLEAARDIYNNNPGFQDLLFEYLDKAISENPNSVEALMLRGNVHLDMGNYEAAMEDYRRAVKIAPESGELHQKLGVILLELERIDEAIAELQKALELGYDNASLHFTLGRAYEAKGELKKALEHHKKSVKLDPRSISRSYAKTLESKIK